MAKTHSKPLTLEDLADFHHDGTALAVLGHPVAHSVSPQMHRAALLAMAQTHHCFADWDYFKLDVPPERLPEALPLLWDKGFLGLNLTIPHKVQAVGLVKEIDPEAEAMGAVNTLKRLPDGGYAGYNSDGYGIEMALKRSFGAEIEGADILLLGAGGAARATAFHCLFRGCRSLTIGNRNPERLGELLQLLHEHDFADRINGFELDGSPFNEDSLPSSFATRPSPLLIINATSLGLKEDDPAPIDLTPFQGAAKVYDMTYGVDNALAKQARELGIPYADGLSMLVWQGVRSLEIWSESAVPAQPMMSAACHAKGFPARDA